jgi:hypothetical protein
MATRAAALTGLIPNALSQPIVSPDGCGSLDHYRGHLLADFVETRLEALVLSGQDGVTTRPAALVAAFMVTAGAGSRAASDVSFSPFLGHTITHISAGPE